MFAVWCRFFSSLHGFFAAVLPVPEFSLCQLRCRPKDLKPVCLASLTFVMFKILTEIVQYTTRSSRPVRRGRNIAVSIVEGDSCTNAAARRVRVARPIRGVSDSRCRIPRHKYTSSVSHRIII
ncbi:hypothetical protein FB451DRAFT_448532 [Mycena latifolia]|nr:hypothetical protein FB451DRAFT_448532 [Mycena latifolia]